jgi:hypothetical protein
VLVELLAGDAGLHDAIQILRVDRDHRLHHRRVDRDPAMRGIRVALEGGPGPESYHRHPSHGAQLHDVDDLIGRLRQHHDVRRLVLGPGERVGVLLSHREARHHPVAEAAV